MTTLVNIDKQFSEKVYSVFRNSGVHGRDWPKCTYAVATYTADGDSQCAIAVADEDGHAEKHIIEHFTKLLANKKLDPPAIKLFLNYSPCHDCSRSIIEFMDGADSNLKVEIVFASFYYIKRPSCDEREECRGHNISSPVHERNVRGLRDLHGKQGVELRTFYEKDWRDLVIALGLVPRKKEDRCMKKDLEELMDPVSSLSSNSEF